MRFMGLTLRQQSRRKSFDQGLIRDVDIVQLQLEYRDTRMFQTIIWVGFNISYHNRETFFFFTIDPFLGNLN